MMARHVRALSSQSELFRPRSPLPTPPAMPQGFANQNVLISPKVERELVE
jgi:hypothetical protein